jgi:hypothetical protein
MQLKQRVDVGKGRMWEFASKIFNSLMSTLQTGSVSLAGEL